ncbi:MAG: hypothetical protein NC343_06720 [Muribaculum sp.]|nr:hypothetical protein [Muribaculaceae bacterium]MCM1081428.1 hypothetical protein [Muribaculum sp.]
MKFSKIINLLITAVLFCSPTLHAQNDVKDQINTIKLDENYLWAEGNDENKDIAFQNALYELVLMINEIRAADGKQPLESSHLSHLVETKSYPRGEKTNMFAYIAFDKAMAVEVRQNLGIVVGQKQESDSVATTTPAKTEPVVAQQQEKPASQPQAQKFTFVPAGSANITSVTARICEYEMVTEANLTLKKYAADGTVKQYNRARSLAEIPSDAHLVLFDREHVIKAVLGPDNGSGRMNMRTQQPDNLNNYHQVAIIWYK